MSRRVRPIAALACFAFATMGAVVSTTAAAQACADNRPTASVPLPGFRFTPERLEHWVGGRRAPPPVATLAEATVRYVIDCGRTDPRLLYPTRIAQQLSASLADWEALTDDVQQRGRRFGPRRS